MKTDKVLRERERERQRQTGRAVNPKTGFTLNPLAHDKCVHYEHTRTGFHVLWGHSIDIMFFLLYKLFYPLALNLNKISEFLYFSKYLILYDS